MLLRSKNHKNPILRPLKKGALLILLSAFLVSCGATKVKYIQHMSSTKLKLADNTVLTAPPGKHYMLYLVNCIDNTKGKDGFFFTSNKLTDANGQDAKEYEVPTVTKLVAKGTSETKIGQVVFLLPGSPAKNIFNLNYNSSGSEKVLMVNQTPHDEDEAFFFYVDEIKLPEAKNSPFIGDNPCADKGSYHN